MATSDDTRIIATPSRIIGEVQVGASVIVKSVTTRRDGTLQTDLKLSDASTAALKSKTDRL